VSNARQRRLAAALGALAVAALAYEFWPRDAPSAARPASVAAGGRSAPAAAPATEAPDVRLRDLSEERPGPGTSARNLFQFQAKPSTPAARSIEPPPPAPIGPPPAPALPPIPLKFIGVAEKANDAKKIAILSDGRGTYWGHEGEVVEGRYRILKIGAESIEMAYLDGRGRQVIRLTGS